MNSTPDFRIVKRLADIANDFPETSFDITALILKLIGKSPVQSLEPSISEMVIAKQGRKLDAIKEYRERTKQPLKEAKDAIERAGYQLGFYDIAGHDLGPSGRFARGFKVDPDIS